MVLVSNGRREVLPVGTNGFNKCLSSRRNSATTSCHNSILPTLTSVGQWVSTQRYHCKLHQEGKPNHITLERIRALDGIGFEWKTGSAASWNERFQQILELKVQFGHYLVLQQYSANPNLGQWVSTQRRLNMTVLVQYWH